MIALCFLLLTFFKRLPLSGTCFSPSDVLPLKFLLLIVDDTIDASFAPEVEKK